MCVWAHVCLSFSILKEGFRRWYLHWKRSMSSVQLPFFCTRHKLVLKSIQHLQVSRADVNASGSTRFHVIYDDGDCEVFCLFCSYFGPSIHRVCMVVVTFYTFATFARLHKGLVWGWIEKTFTPSQSRRVINVWSLGNTWAFTIN